MAPSDKQLSDVLGFEVEGPPPSPVIDRTGPAKASYEALAAFRAEQAEYDAEYATLEKGDDGRDRMPGMAAAMARWGRR